MPDPPVFRRAVATVIARMTGLGAGRPGWRRRWRRRGWTRFRASCCTMPGCGLSTRRPARRTAGSGRRGRGSEVAGEVRAMACGLAARGFRRGMHLAIIGDNRPRLYWAMCAAQALGGIPVPMYQDAPAADLVFVLNDAEIAYALVEDQEQVDKLLEAQAAGAHARAHLLRRPARTAQLHDRYVLRDAARGRARIRSRTPGILRCRGGCGKRRRCRDHALHLRHHRQAEGCVPDAFGADRGGPRRHRVRPPDAGRSRSCPTCRWPGWATTCSPTRRRWWPASRSTARSPATR